MQLQPPTHCKLSGFILNERCTVSSKMEVHRYVGVGFLCFWLGGGGVGEWWGGVRGAKQSVDLSERGAGSFCIMERVRETWGTRYPPCSSPSCVR